MKGMQRIISGWLVICMVFSMLPQVYATEEELAERTVQADTVEIDGTSASAEDRAAADAVAVLIAALPTLEEIVAKPTEVQLVDYYQVQACYDAYEALTERQKALLPAPEEVFKSYFDYFNNQTSVIASGTCGDNAKWYISGKTLVIYGSGDMYDYGDEEAPWAYYISSGNSEGPYVTSIQIGNQITSIGDYAFWNNYGITSISIGSGVKKIGEYSCQFDQIETLELPNSLNEIEDFAFAWCYNLKTVELPESLEILGHGSFYACSGLTSVHIPASVQDFALETMLGEHGVFSFCSGITDFTVDQGNSILTAQDGVLFNKDMTCLIQYPLGSENTIYSIPDSVSVVSGSAFNYSQYLKSIVIPASVQELDLYAFANCAQLQEVTFKGDAPEYIAYELFTDSEVIAYYPTGNTSWESVIQREFAGNVTWKDVGPNGEMIGACGDDLTWMFNRDTGTLTITGTGEMDGYYEGNWAPWHQYREDILSIIFIDGVTTIGSYAFYGCKNLISVTFPDSITLIDSFTFEGCSSLTSIAVPNSVTSLGPSGVFYGCSNLTNVMLPDAITSIGQMTFMNCSSLTSLTIPDSVTYIGYKAFYGCSLLTSVSIPENVTTIGNSVFSFCSALEEIYFCGDAPNFGETCFFDTTATVYYPADNATWTEDVMQNYGGNITWKTHCDNGHTEVIDEAVAPTCTTSGLTEGRHCSACGEVIVVQEVIPAGHNYEVIVIEPTCVDQGYTTHTCSGCNDSYVDSYVNATGVHSYLDGVCEHCGVIGGTCGDNLTWTLVDGVLTISGTGEMDDYIQTDIGDPASFGSSHPWAEYIDDIISIKIEQGVSTIGDNAFPHCVHLRSVILPDTVTSIGSTAFAGCSSLENIEIPDSVNTICRASFSDCTKLNNIVLPSAITSISAYTFSNCTGLTSILIPDSVVTIEAGAFSSCSSITHISIPASVKSFGEQSFQKCISLQEIEIPASITSLGYFYTFAECIKLERIKFLGNVPSMGTDTFADIVATAYYPANNSTWTEDVMKDYGGTITWVAYGEEHVHEFDADHKCKCGAIGGTLGEDLWWYFEEKSGTLTIFGNGEMVDFNSSEDQPWHEFWEKITDVVIEEGVTSVGQYAFYGHSRLMSIHLPDSLNSIGYGAFYYCISLLSIEIPEGVTSIPDSAFNQCYKLRNVSVPESVTSIGTYAFCQCTSLTNINIPDAVTRIGEAAFVNCKKLTNINIPVGITSIERKTFTQCTSLTEIAIPNTVTCIDYEAFYACAGLATLIIPDSVTEIGIDAFTNCYGITDIYYSGIDEQWVALGDYRPDGTFVHFNCASMLDHWTTEHKDPTCTEAGYTRMNCSCGYFRNETEIFAEGHAKETIPGVDATCTETGLTAGVHCSVCGETLVKQEVIPATGHAYQHFIVAPSCVDKGYTTHTCSNCGDSYVDNVVEALGHDEITDEAAAPSCTETGLTEGSHCTTCGAVLRDQDKIPAMGHTLLVDPAVEPTCTKTGLTAGAHCVICETIIKKQETIPAKDHIEKIISGKIATCTESGLTDGKKCSVCNTVTVVQEVIPAKGHDYQDGSCRVCGENEIGAEEPSVPAKPVEPNEPTEPSEPADKDVARVAGGSRYSTCIAVADELKATLGGEDFSSVVVASGADFPDALAGTYLTTVKNAPILLIADTHIDMMVEYIDNNMADDGTIYILGSENSVSKKAADALSAVGNVKRLGGKSRFITNLRILEEVGAKTGELLVVYSVAPWDALSVSSSGCPILLVNDKLRDDQKQYLETTSFDKITIIGSTAGVPDTMEAELSAYCSNIDRVYGKNRFMTSIEVAEYFYGTEKGSIVVACGTNFPDGLCSGALAHAKKAPVILTDAGRESLVADYVTEHNVQSGYVIGSAKVVSDASVRKAFNMTETDIIK